MNTQGKIATVGTFDGMHRGHQLVASTLLQLSLERGLQPMAITFRQHPLSIIAPERAPKLLCTTEEKIELMRGAGLNPNALEFDKKMQMLSARQWLEYLRDGYGARAVLLGYDNTFGHDGRSLSIEAYKEIGRDLGLEIYVAPHIDGISSSAVRKTLREGHVEKVNEMLGRLYSLKGEVVTGNQIGRTIGFPTANILVDEELELPAHGVYAVEASIEESTPRPAIVNIGVRPTVEDAGHVSVECHIPGFSGNLYGRQLKIRFTRRIRGEERFASLSALQAAIARDLSSLR